MQILKKIIYSKNVWTIGFAMFIVWFAFSAFASMLSSLEQTKEIFLYILEIVLVSYLGASLMVYVVTKILNFNSLLEYFEMDLSWIFVLALGSIFFVLLFGHPQLFVFEVFSGIFLLSFVTAVLFRIVLKFAISFPMGSKDTTELVLD